MLLPQAPTTFAILMHLVPIMINAYFTYSFPELNLWLRKTLINYEGENNNNNDGDDHKME